MSAAHKIRYSQPGVQAMLRDRLARIEAQLKELEPGRGLFGKPDDSPNEYEAHLIAMDRRAGDETKDAVYRQLASTLRAYSRETLAEIEATVEPAPHPDDAERFAARQRLIADVCRQREDTARAHITNFEREHNWQQAARYRVAYCDLWATVEKEIKL